MRFTRPGARPSHRPQARLDSTQLRGGVLGASVEDERAGADLGAGEIFQLVRGSVRRIELDMEVVMASAAAGRFLVHRHYIGKRTVEKAIVLLQESLQRARKRLVVIGVEISEPTAVAGGRQVDLVRPARERWDECNPVVIAQHGAPAAPFILDDVAIKTPTRLSQVPCLGRQLSLNYWRHEGICVDLAVGMAQSDADRLTAILEDIHVAAG